MGKSHSTSPTIPCSGGLPRLDWRVYGLITVMAGMFGCREDSREVAVLPPETQPPAIDLSGHSPVPGHHLDRSIPTNAGLLSMLGVDGLPMRTGDTVDPMVIESRRFYDTLGSPSQEPQSVDYPDPFTGEPPGMRKSAPVTLEAWKQVFGFPARLAEESLEKYRVRIGAAIYYNRNELGLGRELGCSDFVDGQDATGAPLIGLACFVTNFGSIFRDETHALALALAGG
ncbi:MAG TPA: hypothetical protein VF491_23995, partial [Vicinamibacterales bacterium]